MADKAEACLNIWLIVDEDSQLIYRAAARAYVLAGSDESKLHVLKSLSGSDYHVAKHYPLTNHKTTIIDGNGRARELNGFFVKNLESNFPHILGRICDDLEKDFPPQPVVNLGQPSSYRMKLPREPYYVLTFLFENDREDLRPHVPR